MLHFTGFFVHVKTDYTYNDIANYELDKPLPKGKNKEVIVLKKDELGGKLVT